MLPHSNSVYDRPWSNGYSVLMCRSRRPAVTEEDPLRVLHTPWRAERWVAPALGVRTGRGVVTGIAGEGHPAARRRGFASPVRTLAVASATRTPGDNSELTAATSSAQGISTGSPVLSHDGVRVRGCDRGDHVVLIARPVERRAVGALGSVNDLRTCRPLSPGARCPTTARGSPSVARS
jgi:hypothetical protein